MAARELSAFRNTNSVPGRWRVPEHASEGILFVRQTGAVQHQRESSTEPPTKMWNVSSCTSEGEVPLVLTINWGRGFPPGGSLASLELTAD